MELFDENVIEICLKCLLEDQRSNVVLCLLEILSSYSFVVFLLIGAIGLRCG